MFNFRQFLKQSPPPAPGALWRECVSNAKCYGEYGVGESTLYAAEMSEATIVAVDSSKEWVNQICKKTAIFGNRVNIEHADVGSVGEWGYPIDWSYRHKFPSYASRLWEINSNYDLIFIDGRFRISCFLSCLLHAKPGSLIVFDDYHRSEYQIASDWLSVREYDRESDQALFEVVSFDRESVREELGHFQFVTA